MLKIRLQRAGRKRMPVYRVVVAEHTMPVQGRFIEKLGSFIGGQKDTTMNLNIDRIKHWISVGAQPSQTMARLLVDQGVKEAEKFIKARAQKPSKQEERAAAAKAEAEAKAAEEAAAAAEAAEAPAEEVAEETPAEESTEAPKEEEAKEEAPAEEAEEKEEEEAPAEAEEAKEEEKKED